MSPFVIPPAIEQLTDDVLRHELVDWALVLQPRTATYRARPGHKSTSS